MPAKRKTQQRQIYRVDELEVIRPEEFRFIHANRARVSENFFDASLIFSAILPSVEVAGTPPYLEERVGVSMSWEHLRALRDILTERIENYEAQMGPIRDLTEAPSAKPKKPKPTPKSRKKPYPVN